MKDYHITVPLEARLFIKAMTLEKAKKLAEDLVSEFLDSSEEEQRDFEIADIEIVEGTDGEEA